MFRIRRDVEALTASFANSSSASYSYKASKCRSPSCFDAHSREHPQFQMEDGLDNMSLLLKDKENLLKEKQIEELENSVIKKRHHTHEKEKVSGKQR